MFRTEEIKETIKDIKESFSRRSSLKNEEDFDDRLPEDGDGVVKLKASVESEVEKGQGLSEKLIHDDI